jgi:hypothetical protein
VSAMIFRHQTRILTLISGCAKFYGKGVGGAGFSLPWDVLTKIKKGKPTLESKIKIILRMIFDKDDQIGTILIRMKGISCTVRYDPQSRG